MLERRTVIEVGDLPIRATARVATLPAREKMHISATGEKIGRLYRISLDNVPIYGHEYSIKGIQWRLSYGVWWS